MPLISICPTCNTVKQINSSNLGIYFIGFEKCSNCEHIEIIIDKKAYDILLDPPEESVKNHNSIFNKLRYIKDVKYNPYIKNFSIPYFYLKRSGLDIFNTCLINYLESMKGHEMYVKNYMKTYSIILALNRAFPLDCLMYNSIPGINFPATAFESLDSGIYAFNNAINQKGLAILLEEKYGRSIIYELSCYFSHYLFLLSYMFETGALAPKLTNVEIGMVKILGLYIPDYIYDSDLGKSKFFLGKIKTLVKVLNDENT